MKKINKKAFEHFKGVYELKCGWEVDDDFYNEVIDPEITKLTATIYRAEFAFKCCYPGERPLSKKDYARVRFTHRILEEKCSTLCHVRTRTEIEESGKGVRAFQIQKYLMGTDLSWEEALERPDVQMYIEEGRCKRGSWIHKYVVDIHHF